MRCAAKRAGRGDRVGDEVELVCEPCLAGLACGGEVVGWEGEEVGEVGLFGGGEGGEGFWVVVDEHGRVGGM